MSLRRLVRGIAYRAGRAADRVRDAVSPPTVCPPGEAGRTVLLHVGAHKTGSTTLQFLLRQMTRELLRCGVAYDRAGYEMGAELSRRSPLTDGAVATFRADTAARLDACGAPVAVLSSESFFGDAFAGYANVRDVAADVARVLADRDVTIIALVRRQDSFLASLYGQHVKEGGTQTFDAFLGERDPNALDWDARLTAFDDHFGRANVRVHAYETVFRDSEQLLDRAFGAPARRLDFAAPTAPRRNPSLSAEGLRIMAERNATLGDEERRALRKELQETHARVPGEPDALLAGGVGERIVNAHREANERLFDSRLRGDEARAYYLP